MAQIAVAAVTYDSTSYLHPASLMRCTHHVCRTFLVQHGPTSLAMHRSVATLGYGVGPPPSRADPACPTCRCMAVGALNMAWTPEMAHAWLQPRMQQIIERECDLH